MQIGKEHLNALAGELKMQEWKKQEWKNREQIAWVENAGVENACLLYTSPSPRDGLLSRMPSSA